MQDFLGKLGRFLSGDDGADAAGELAEDEVRAAAAALLIHAMVIDGETHETEQARVKSELQQRFDIEGPELDRLIERATREEEDAVDLYRFTKVLTANLDQPGRQKIIRMLWEVVATDGQIHEFESNLVWRVAELLGVSREDRIRMRQEVLASRP